jgi:2-succinyl-5-enolpyruvyl-6-hydroxy-3-cyclohexene-1-carboxylate synthase
VKESMQSIGLTVIEVPTDRQTNTAMHRTLWKTVSTSLDNLLEENT